MRMAIFALIFALAVALRMISQAGMVIGGREEPVDTPKAKRANFTAKCPDTVHTYEITNARVQWWSAETQIVAESRGKSMHCLLARAAQRLGPNINLRLRIDLGDADRKQVLPWTFVPAIKERLWSQRRTSGPLLFPDFTFESWPEVHDDPAVAVARVLSSAERYGLPGTPGWQAVRDTRIAWRGNVQKKKSPQRHRLVSFFEKLNTNLSDIKSIEYDRRGPTVRMRSRNRLTREEHCRFRFLLHMNGMYQKSYSSAIKWKMLCGALVFVPGNPLFLEWWNYKMEPYQHYVPYSGEVDLWNKIQNYSVHLQEAERIAQNGFSLAKAAFSDLDTYVDHVLKQYAALTKGLHQPICTFAESLAPTQPKSLQELQEEYGPTICS